MLTALISTLVAIAQLSLLIGVILVSYAVTLIFLGLCVLAFRTAYASVKNFFGKHLRINKIRYSIQHRVEFSRRYKEEKKKLFKQGLATNNYSDRNDDKVGAV